MNNAFLMPRSYKDVLSVWVVWYGSYIHIEAAILIVCRHPKSEKIRKTVSDFWPISKRVWECQIVVLFICLSDRISQKPDVQISRNFLYMLLWLCPHLTVMRYVMYFRFCGWRHISILWREYGPESKTTRMFRPVRQMAAPKSAVSTYISFCTACV